MLIIDDFWLLKQAIELIQTEIIIANDGDVKTIARNLKLFMETEQKLSLYDLKSD